jgi:hypothetical protein
MLRLKRFTRRLGRFSGVTKVYHGLVAAKRADETMRPVLTTTHHCLPSKGELPVEIFVPL